MDEPYDALGFMEGDPVPHPLLPGSYRTSKGQYSWLPPKLSNKWGIICDGARTHGTPYNESTPDHPIHHIEWNDNCLLRL